MNTEPVIFEPIRNIRLRRATYKVTSYINFDPYLTNFDNLVDIWHLAKRIWQMKIKWDQ